MSVIPFGISLNNPGNLRPLPSGETWDGQSGIVTTGGQGSYCRFGLATFGGRALDKNLLAYKREYGTNTVQGVFNIWAPSADHNDPHSYASFVAAAMGIQPDTAIDIATPAFLVPASKAISLMENGHPQAGQGQSSGLWYADSIYEMFAVMALGSAHPAPVIPISSAISRTVIVPAEISADDLNRQELIRVLKLAA